MDRKKFALIKYDHGEPTSLSGVRKAWLALVVAVAMGSLFVFPLLSILLLIVMFVIFHQPKRLYIGPRYLICGGKILYYANVQRLQMEAHRGTLLLKSSTGRVLVIEQDKFQSGARKEHKIAAHKEARFQKVAQKIVKHVRRAAPHAVLTGVDDLPATGT